MGQGRLAHEWKDSVIVSIHKKGDKMDCDIYTGITLFFPIHVKFSEIYC